jgi:fibronectin-binding autotransporter adhesin
MAQLQDTTINDTGFITIPSGDTAQRPTPTPGMIRLNTANNLLEFYDATGWRPITGISRGSIGTGGNTILYAGSNVGRANGVVHMFTSAGSHTFTPAFTGTVEVLVIGGGGSGGGHLGAGGGAGGVISNRAFPVTAGSGIPITVAGTAAAPPAYAQSSTNGSNSVFGSITANGGGGGGSWNGYAGRPGGSGGGGNPGSNGAGSNGHTGPNDSRNKNLGGFGLPGQGFPGGAGIRFNRQSEDTHKAGGGGGAGGPGFSAEDDKQQGLLQDGGPGIANNIMGYTLYWGGGGGGSMHFGNSTLSSSGGIGGGGGSTQTHGAPNYPSTQHGGGVGGGMALNSGAGGVSHFQGGNAGENTGGGGGGAYGQAGNGGSGIVIVRY